MKNQHNAKKPKNCGGFAFWAKNLGAVLFVYVILIKVPALNVGYDWLMNSYLKGNLQMVRENPHLTNEERMGAKMGSDFNFLLFLRSSTPENAVILYPTKANFLCEYMGQKSPFSGQIVDKLSAVRWVYPRRIIMHEEMGKSSWSNKITHVAIVNGQGKEYLPYPVDSTYVTGVLPIKPDYTNK